MTQVHQGKYVYIYIYIEGERERDFKISSAKCQLWCVFKRDKMIMTNANRNSFWGNVNAVKNELQEIYGGIKSP